MKRGPEVQLQEPKTKRQSKDKANSDPDASKSNESSDAEELEVVFEQMDMNDELPEVYHFVKNSLNPMAVLLSDQSGEAFCPADTARAIVEQGNIGGYVKDQNDTEGGEHQVYGFYSILNIHQHFNPIEAMLKKISSWNLSKRLKQLIDGAYQHSKEELEDDTELGNCTGFLFVERMFNLPVPIIADMIKSLLEDVRWSMTVNDPEVGMTEGERKYYRFSDLVVLVPIGVTSAGKKIFYGPEAELFYKHSTETHILPLGSKMMTVSPSTGKEEEAEENLALCCLKYKKLTDIATTLAKIKEGAAWNY